MGKYIDLCTVIDVEPEVSQVLGLIEAIQFIDNADRIIEIQEFLGGDTIVISYEDADNPYMYIETLEGTMKASVGDYIIKGVNGEFYPCKPDIFEKTYEEVAE